MYTLENLQQKNLKELKKIGWQLHVMPEGDKRCRQNWIDALVGVNLPLLQLLEVSPAAEAQQPIIETVETSTEVEPETPLESKFGRIVYPRPAQEAIVLAAKNSPGVEVEPVQEAIVLEDKTPLGVERSVDYLDCPNCGAVHGLYATDEYYRWEARCIHCSFVQRFVHHPFEYTRPFELPLDRLDYLPVKPINSEQATKTCTGVEFERALNAMAEATKDTPDVQLKQAINALVPTVLFVKRGVYELVPEPPDPSNFARSQPLSEAIWGYYDRYPYWLYRDGRTKFNTKIFLDTPLNRMWPGVDYCPTWYDIHGSFYTDEPIAEAAETSPGVEVDRIQGAIKTLTEPGKFNGKTTETDERTTEAPRLAHTRTPLRCQRLDASRGSGGGDDFEGGIAKHRRSDRLLVAAGNDQRDRRQALRRKSTELAAETSPGVEVDQVEKPKCAECFDDGFIEDEFGRVIVCRCNKKPKLSRQKTQSAIAPAAKNHLEEDSDRNPILTGMALSDRFLARYSPPQPEIEFNVGTDGQLSLLDFNVAYEPPDPDDFESLDDFREAIARWDEKHPSTFDHCSDIPSSVHNDLSSVHNDLSSVQKEPPDPEDFDSMFAFWAAYDAWVADDEPLTLSLDSFCEWVPCPDTWYESAEVVEVAPSVAIESSITCNFFIPTFDAWCDRFNRSDEPPDTGIYARLPKPKPPSFPLMAASQARAKCILNAFQTNTKSILNASRTHTHCMVAGSSTQPARSPPGGDQYL
jgi:predicted  nucleic acid-binding Zn-ribbon protein